jgi:hypothetical protein
MNKFWLMFAAGNMAAAGQALQAQDADNTGKDDVIGTVLVASGSALQAYASGSDAGFKRWLKVAADAIYTYLGQAAPQSAQPATLTAK